MSFLIDLIHIAYGSIRQRGVASVLTMFSMALGVTLVVAVLSIHGVIDRSFKNNASVGYNMIVGAKGGQEQLTLSTVYYLSRPIEVISGKYYLEFLPQEKRDELLVHSFAYRGHEMQAALNELRQATSLGLGGPLELLADDLLAGTARAHDAKRIELGRDGKYADMNQFAIPVCLGDFYDRFRVVGTTPGFFDNIVYDVDNPRKYQFAQGRNFVEKDPKHGYFEAVVGSQVARELNIQLGHEFSPSHGREGGAAHASKFTVVGILKPSGTPNDRAVFINMEGFYLMEGHAKPVETEEPGKETMSDASRAEYEAIFKLPPEEQSAAWERWKEKQKQRELAPDQEPLAVEQRDITAILMKVDLASAIELERAVNKGKEAQAVMPVSVIYGMFEFFISPLQTTLLILTTLICVVSGVSILVSIYNSMSERRHEIAVMRALGAGRFTVLTIILLESTLLSLGGGFFGWLAGHLLCLIASPIIEDRTGVRVGFNIWGDPFVSPLKWLGLEGPIAEWISMPLEWTLVPGLVLLAVIVGLWPAIAAYRTDVAKSLGK